MKLSAGALYWYGVKIIKGEQRAEEMPLPADPVG